MDIHSHIGDSCSTSTKKQKIQLHKKVTFERNTLPKFISVAKNKKATRSLKDTKAKQAKRIIPTLSAKQRQRHKVQIMSDSESDVEDDDEIGKSKVVFKSLMNPDEAVSYHPAYKILKKYALEG